MMDMIPSADVRVRKSAAPTGKPAGVAPLTWYAIKTLESEKWHDCRAENAGTVECVVVR